MTSNDKMPQGTRANYAGKAYENMLKPVFETYDYEILNWAAWRDRGLPPEKSGKVAIKQFPYTTIYNRGGKTEWLLVNNDKDRIVRVEVKSQRGEGSVIEKMPYMYLNAVQAYPEKEIILLVDGTGTEKAMPWLRKVVDEKWLQEGTDKDIKLMNLTEFIDYFIKELS